MTAVVEEFLENLEDIPNDAIVQNYLDFLSDRGENKVNLSIGTVMTEDRKLHVFESVKLAEKNLLEKYQGKPYLFDNGTKEFSTLTQILLFGEDSKYIKEKKICSFQTVGGTGALHFIFKFLKKCDKDTMYVANVPYVNHVNMLNDMGFKVKYYPFFDKTTGDIDYPSFLKGLKELQQDTAVLIQPSCCNPCSVSIDEKYFDDIIDIVLEKSIYVVFDVAYQGYGGEGIDKDVMLVRRFVERGVIFACCHSFSKTLSLYGDRAGVLHVVCRNKVERMKVGHYLVKMARAVYSYPPLYPNRLVTEILGNEELKKKWLQELHSITQYISSKRNLFFDQLQTHQKKYNLSYDWSSFKKQKGMFCFVPIFEHIYKGLREKHIYIVGSGRINVSGVCAENIDYVIDTICQLLKEKNVKA